MLCEANGCHAGDDHNAFESYGAAAAGACSENDTNRSEFYKTVYLGLLRKTEMDTEPMQLTAARTVIFRKYDKRIAIFPMYLESLQKEKKCWANLALK